MSFPLSPFSSSILEPNLEILDNLKLLLQEIFLFGHTNVDNIHISDEQHSSVLIGAGAE